MNASRLLMTGWHRLYKMPSGNILSDAMMLERGSNNIYVGISGVEMDEGGVHTTYVSPHMYIRIVLHSKSGGGVLQVRRGVCEEFPHGKFTTILHEGML